MGRSKPLSVRELSLSVIWIVYGLVLNAIGNITLTLVILFACVFTAVIPHCSGIRQWGNPFCEATEKYVSFPISFNQLYVVTEAHQVSALSDFKMVSIYQTKNTGFTKCAVKPRALALGI